MATTAPPKNGEMQAIKDRAASVRDLLMSDQVKQQISLCLPKHITAERMVRVFTTAVMKNPTLLECTRDSMLGAIVQASELGLEPTGFLGQAYLIPRNNKKTGNKEVNLQPGYKGLLELARRSGEISTAQMRTVFERDKFDYQLGTNPYLTHKPYEDGDPGKAVFYYAIITLKDGGFLFEVISHAAAIAHRNKYGQKPKYGPWTWETNENEMAMKTVLIKALKLAPVSIECQKAIALDELAENSVPQGLGTPFSLIQDAEVSSLDEIADQLQNERTVEPVDDEPGAVAEEVSAPVMSEKQIESLINRAGLQAVDVPMIEYHYGAARSDWDAGMLDDLKTRIERCESGQAASVF